jgi:hypothetical protein
MFVRSIEQSAERYIRKSLMAYLEGQKNLKWIISIIGSGTEARQLFSAMHGYGKPERRWELSDWFAAHN